MTPFEAIHTDVVKRTLDFSGRSSRSEYWWTSGAIIVGALLLLILHPFAADVWVVVLCVPGIAVGMRRLRDGGYPAWVYPLYWAYGLVGVFIALPPLLQIADGVLSTFLALLLVWWLTRPSKTPYSPDIKTLPRGSQP